MKSTFLFSALCLAITSHTHAAMFCVGNEQDLTDALATAQNNNGESDDIRIRTKATPYIVPQGGWQTAVHNNNEDLIIRGGYIDTNCQVRVINPALTVLDGTNANRPLRIDTDSVSGVIEVSGLTFQNGRGEGTGGLKVSDPGPIYFGDILIEHNIFSNNTGITSPIGEPECGGLLAATDGPNPNTPGGTGLVIRNNIFSGNRAGNLAAAFFFSNNQINISNNTFFNNQSTNNNLQQREALNFFTFMGAHFSNNIFWGNNPDNLANTFDLNLSGDFTGATLVKNVIQAPTGQAVTNDNTPSQDPQFVNSANGNFRLKYGSPLINAGVNNPDGGISLVDLDGTPRIDNTTIDLGAYESNYVFVAGFE